MKKILLFLMPLIILCSCTSFEKNTFIKDKESLSKKVRIAVLPFTNYSNSVDSGVNVSDAITSEIIKIKNWNVVERSHLPKIIQEQKIEAAGLTAQDYNKIGKLTNVDYLIIGSVAEYSYDRRLYIVPQTKLAVNMRIINTTNGEIVGTGRYVYETGKHAWCGCCLLGWYYIPLALFSTENINNDLNEMAEKIAKDIKKQIGDNDNSGCLSL